MIEKVDPNGETIRYNYDANGNRKTVRDPDGKVTTYNYDALNRVSEVVNAQGITQYRYDRSSLKTRVTYPNGTQAQTTYDNAGRTLTITNTQNMAVVSSYEYQYDANGNRTQQVEVNGGSAETTTYDFDLNDRLIEVVYPDKTTTYTYDAAYNRKTELTTGATGITEDKTYTYNNRNQVTAITDSVNGEEIDYAYDANGNRLSKTVTPASGSVATTEFIYDVRDQLRTIQQGGSTIGAFLYDYQGLRIRKQTATETTRYVYDDQSVLLQTDDLGNTVAKYDYGPDKLLSLNHVSEGSQFYLFDSLGSVVNLTRPDGAIQARYQYDAWGNVRNEVGSSTNVFGFTGHEMDDESGLIYMKARFYDPELGQFLSHDAFEGTADTPPSLHKYLYAFANPVVFVDLDGNQSVDASDLEKAQRASRGDQRVFFSREEIPGGVNVIERGGRFFEVIDVDPRLVGEIQAREQAKRGTETVEYSRGPGTSSAVTESCNDLACEIQHTREKTAGAFRKTGEIASTTGDVIDVVVTPDETDVAAAVLGGPVGAVANKGRKVKKSMEAIDEGGDATRFIVSVKVVDRRSGEVFEGTVDLKPTLDRIRDGKKFSHRNDGSVFRNSEGLLPKKQEGYYTEYVHPTPGINGPGPQRIVKGREGELYYTPDHYKTFIPVNP